MLILDLRGLHCPLPVLRTQKALRSLYEGQEIHVICSDALAEVDIPDLLRHSGDILVSMEHDQGFLVFHIRKGKVAGRK